MIDPVEAVVWYVAFLFSVTLHEAGHAGRPGAAAIRLPGRPLPPLDGSGALPLILPAETAERLRAWLAQPGLGWIGLLAWWIFPEVFGPIFLFTVNLLHLGAGYG